MIIEIGGGFFIALSFRHISHIVEGECVRRSELISAAEVVECLVRLIVIQRCNTFHAEPVRAFLRRSLRLQSVAYGLLISERNVADGPAAPVRIDRDYNRL